MNSLLYKLKFYPTKNMAFEYENGDNFFIIDNLWVCLSENNPLFLEMLKAGYKTELQIYKESNK
jgi:hypothetical protein